MATLATLKTVLSALKGKSVITLVAILVLLIGTVIFGDQFVEWIKGALGAVETVDPQ